MKKNNLERKGIFYAEKSGNSDRSSSGGDGSSSAESMDEYKSGPGLGSPQGPGSASGKPKQIRQQGGNTLRYDGKTTSTGKTCRARHFEPWIPPPPQSRLQSQPIARPNSYGSWQWISSLVASIPLLTTSPLPRWYDNTPRHGIILMKPMNGMHEDTSLNSSFNT